MILAGAEVKGDLNSSVFEIVRKNMGLSHRHGRVLIPMKDQQGRHALVNIGFGTRVAGEVGLINSLGEKGIHRIRSLPEEGRLRPLATIPIEVKRASQADDR